MEVDAMGSKKEADIHSSFIDRLKDGGWWRANNELLNMFDIHKRPSYYKGTAKEWIEEIATFAYLYPGEWDEIYKQYRSMSKHEFSFHFYRNEEGYLRMTGADEVYLKVAGEGEPLSHEVLDRIGRMLSEHAEKLFYTFLEYVGMDDPEQKCWMERIEKNIQENLTGQGLAVTMAETLDESAFEGNELYFDLLNNLYIIL
jgi:hypothetical protein